MEKNDERNNSAQTQRAGAGQHENVACADERSPTLLEEINEAIQDHAERIAHLLELKRTTPGAVLHMPVSRLRELAYPGNPF